MQDQKLIDLVRQNSLLYDVTHPKYMDPKLKLTVWNDIGRELNSTGTQCKSRWTNIRDHFRRHLGKRLSKNGQAAVAIKKYKYEDILQFLLPHLSEKQSLPESSNTTTSLEEEEFYSNEEDPIKSEEEADKSFDENVQESDQSLDKQRPISGDRENENFKTLKRKLPVAESVLLKYLTDKNNTENKDDQHPIDAFLAGIAATVKRFPPHYQHLAKGRIFAAVHEIEFQQLDSKHS